jgi:hypothetical protein
MPAETSIPCSKEARDLVQKAKGEASYDEFLKQVFSEGWRHSVSENN